MRRALPILLAAFALFEAADGTFQAVHFAQGHLPGAFLGHLMMWTRVTASLALIGAAHGMRRGKKWGWNLGVGLLGLRAAELSLQVAGGLADGSWPDWPASVQMSAVTALLAAGALLTLLALARHPYRTAFPSDAQSRAADARTNSHFRPVAAGFLLLLAGFLAVGIPSGDPEHPSFPGFVCTALLWSGAVLCFFERRWRLPRAVAAFALILPLLGLILSALRGAFWQGSLFLGGLELIVAAPAYRVLSGARRCFLD